MNAVLIKKDRKNLIFQYNQASCKSLNLRILLLVASVKYQHLVYDYVHIALGNPLLCSVIQHSAVCSSTVYGSLGSLFVCI